MVGRVGPNQDVAATPCATGSNDDGTEAGKFANPGERQGALASATEFGPCGAAHARKDEREGRKAKAAGGVVGCGHKIRRKIVGVGVVGNVQDFT